MAYMFLILWEMFMLKSDIQIVSSNVVAPIAFDQMAFSSYGVGSKLEHDTESIFLISLFIK